MRASKGSAFEREICKKLSLWWSSGKDDDIFWRSSQSGGRATQRAKKGQTTYGSYGDIAAVNPIGEPLIKMFTIELKRGSSHGCPGDLLDFKEDNSKHPWMKCLKQAIKAHKAAGSKAWMLICRRDRRQAMVFIESRIFRLLRDNQPIAERGNVMSLYLTDVHLVGIGLEVFLKNITPAKIINQL